VPSGELALWAWVGEIGDKTLVMMIAAPTPATVPQPAVYSTEAAALSDREYFADHPGSYQNPRVVQLGIVDANG